LNLRNRLGLTSCPRRTQDFDLLAAIFAEGKRTVENWGGQLTVVYLPATTGMACDLFSITQRDRNWLYDSSLTSMERAKVSVIDLKQAYDVLGRPQSFYYFPGSHFSGAGYKFVADAIAKALSN
jgi:hypothetical protein